MNPNNASLIKQLKNSFANYPKLKAGHHEL